MPLLSKLFYGGLKNDSGTNQTSVITRDWNLTATDRNGNTIARQQIEYSDFPLKEIKLYLIDGVLLLPSEN